MMDKCLVFLTKWVSVYWTNHAEVRLRFRTNINPLQVKLKIRLAAGLDLLDVRNK